MVSRRAGLSKNDPGPDAPNSKNLEAGGQQDYPNLASVPPAPTQALSTEEREALTQHLVADRANAKYIDEQLRVGPASAAAPPPAPAAVAKSSPRAAGGGRRSAARCSPQAPAPQAATPSGSASRGNATGGTNRGGGGEAAGIDADQPGSAEPAAAGSAARRSATAPGRSRRRRPGGGQRSGATRTSCPGACGRAPPRAPRLRPRPARAPAQVASLPPAAPAPAAARNAAAPVAQITFASNSTRLSAADQRTLDEVVPMQQRSGGAVRVVGYAPEGRGGVAQQLASFKMALDRANAVAAALREAGVEPNRILVEAAPPTPETGVMAQRAEIFLVN